MKSIRIGAGAAFSNDRILASVDLVERGRLDYLVLECLAERTLAHGHIDRLRDPSLGYNPGLRRRLKTILKQAVERRTRIVTNMGSANPRAAGQEAARVAAELGVAAHIAVVEGDDVSHLVGPDTMLTDIGRTIGELGAPPVSANAYIGIDALLPALDSEADLIIAGRVADSSLFLAPAVHAFGWHRDDWDRIACGALAGHLLECTTQVSGGYYADPPYKLVPDIGNVGYPIGELYADGRTRIEKLLGTGGCITPMIVKEQLLYEVHDPRRYLTPDVSADFSRVSIETPEPDVVVVGNARGHRRPEMLKVVVGFDGGLQAEGELSYAGPGALGRAELAREILLERLLAQGRYEGELRIDVIGANALHATAMKRSAVTEDVRVRAALRSHKREDGEILLEEVECLAISGPAGGGGFRGRLTPSIVTHTAFVDRSAVETRVEVIAA
jgi:hypothetical protein